jgi:hypothetical protein
LCIAEPTLCLARRNQRCLLSRTLLYTWVKLAYIFPHLGAAD